MAKKNFKNKSNAQKSLKSQTKKKYFHAFAFISFKKKKNDSLLQIISHI